MWTCSKCGESIEDQFDACWHCSTPKPDDGTTSANSVISPVADDAVDVIPEEVGAADDDQSMDEIDALVFAGIRNVVVALDAATGEEVWRTGLGGTDFVTVCWDGEALFAANGGEVCRLDPRSGDMLWQNPLKGLGFGIVSLASTRVAATDSGTVAAAAALQRQGEQQAADAAIL